MKRAIAGALALVTLALASDVGVLAALGPRPRDEGAAARCCQPGCCCGAAGTLCRCAGHQRSEDDAPAPSVRCGDRAPLASGLAPRAPEIVARPRELALAIEPAGRVAPAASLAPPREIRSPPSKVPIRPV
jgi:hypothetical protein